VLEFSSDRDLVADAASIDLMATVGVQLSRVMERAKLQEHLLTIADQMQQRIAQDLHDDVGQEMTGLALKAETLAEMLDPGNPCREASNGKSAAALYANHSGDRDRAGALAADLLVAAKRTQDKVRGLARRILPIELELNSLPGALERLCDAARGAGLGCAFRNSHPDETFGGRIAAQLYRIAQEAIANAIRHARPRNIRIKLAKSRGQTLLSVSDDGCGMPPQAEAGGGLGMRIMRYRAGLIGAALELSPGSGGRGTTVTCRLPAAVESTFHPQRKRKRRACPQKS
jgi:signal transduction histidine kinase